MDTGLGHVLLAGGTGMLSEAARWLAERSESLTLAARNPHSLAAELGAIPHPLDWTEPDAVDILPDRKFNLVISWLHDDGIWLARPFEDLLVSDGRSIRIHGSDSLSREIRADRDPDPRLDIVRQTVILGWHQGKTCRRWLNHGEICQGVISAVRQPQKEILIVGDTGLADQAPLR